LASSVINAVIIIVLGIIYRKIAVLMANWENHKFQQDWEDSLVSKNFAFQFVNSNIALFSTAFNEQDFNNLSYQLAIIMVVKQVVTGVVEMILPKIGVWWRRRKLKLKYKSGFSGMAEEPRDRKL
jgi:hypothetical protein